MIKKLSYITLFLMFGASVLLAKGESNLSDPLTKEASIQLKLNEEIDLDTADLDFGDAELSEYLFNKAETSCCHKNKRRNHVYDYIIIGNGTAGATLARKLTDNKRTKVLVIEAGQNRADDPVVNTAAFDLNAITYNPKYAVTYTNPPFSGLPQGQPFTYTEGRMWGGGSGHHYLNYVRGTPGIYDEWAAASGNSQWSYNNLLPILKGLETYTSNGSPINTNQRGLTGPVYSTQQAPITLSNPVVAGVLSGFDIPYVEDYNDPTQSHIGVSPRQLFVTPDNQFRSWSIPSYLPVGVVVDEDGNGLDGRKLKIVSNSLVSEVLFDNNRAIGVEFFHGEEEQKTVKVYAKKRVILAAGAINSPAILQRSGIGDPTLLNALGIPVRFANSNVGANLKTHYGSIGYINGSTPQVLIGFTDMHDANIPNDGERRYQFFAQNVAGQVRIQGWNLNPQSTGSLQIVSRSALTQPQINFNLYSDGPYTTPGTDAYFAISFLKFLQNVATDINVSVPGTVVTNPTPAQYATDAQLFDAVRGNTSNNILGNILNFVITNHMVGTTRMSQTAATGVVDGNLNVHGVRGLMVVDIGVEPRIVDGNTCVGAYALGLKAYDIIASGN